MHPPHCKYGLFGCGRRQKKLPRPVEPLPIIIDTIADTVTKLIANIVTATATDKTSRRQFLQQG